MAFIESYNMTLCCINQMINPLSRNPPYSILWYLLFLLLAFLFTTALGSTGLLALDTARTAPAVGRGEGEVDVLLRVETDHVGGDVDDLLADADVALLDQDTGVVDGLGETELVDAGLQTTLEEVLGAESQDVIELHARLIEHTDAHETANQRIAFEETLGVLLVESEELTGSFISLCMCCVQVKYAPSSTTDLGQSELDTPDLALVAQAVLADNLQFRVTSERLGTEHTT